MFVTDVFM